MIGLADKGVHERKREVDGQFVYHQSWLLEIAVRFRADVRLISVDNAIVSKWEALGDEQPDSSPGGVIVSVPPAARDDEDDR